MSTFSYIGDAIVTDSETFCGAYELSGSSASETARRAAEKSVYQRTVDSADA
jgi:hypothetical protein